MQRTVKGGSMLPYIRPLDVCVTREADPLSLAPGDIIVYKSAGGENLHVHRILDVAGDKTYVTVKGDNIPSRFSEDVSLSRIKEKVIKVKRASRTFDLETAFGRSKGRLMAFLSKHDLAPLLFKWRFIDPFLLSATKTSLFVLLRKLFYKNISFMSTRDEARCNVYAFVGGKKSARAVINKNGGDVLVSSYIRYRDRNPVFAEKFMHKIVEVSDSEYGPGRHIRVDDKVMKDLVGSTDAFFFNDRVSFR